MATASNTRSKLKVDQVPEHRINVSESEQTTPDWRKQLEKSVSDSDWGSMIRILNDYPEAKIEPRLLDLALKNNIQSLYTPMLVKRMTREDLECTDAEGNTPLHTLAWHWPAGVSGAELIAEILIKKNETLPYVFNRDNLLPLHLAKEKQGEDAPLYRYLSQQTDLAKLSNQDQLVALESENRAQTSRWRNELETKVSQGEWESVIGFLEEHQELKTARVTPYEEVPLAVALRDYKTTLPYIVKLVELMTREDLECTDAAGNTPLHTLAWHWPPHVLNAKSIAKLLIEKNENLLYMFNNDNFLPLQLAKEKGEDAPLYLYLSQLCPKQHAFALAMEDPEWNEIPELTKFDGDMGKSVIADRLQALAVNVSAFHSERKFRDWKSLFYNWTRRNNVVEKKSLSTKKLRWRCQQVLQQFAKEEVMKALKAPLFIAAANGNYEVVKEIIKAYPASLKFEDEHHRNFFEIAIINRREGIIGILDSQNYAARSKILSRKDAHGNNVLHLMARKPFLDLASHDVIFIMQREMQWFEKLASMRPKLTLEINNDNKSPSMVFEEEHQEMTQNELSWIFSLATSCSVAASIIATLTFTSVIAVPGGNNDQGFANFTGRNSFTSFIVFDSLALVSSLTSLISFLSIFTARYGVRSFLSEIPNRVIFGVVSMIFSIIFLVIGFGITILLGATSHKILVLLATLFLGAVPLFTLVYLQLPSLSKMITSTYGGTNFRSLIANCWIKKFFGSCSRCH